MVGIYPRIGNDDVNSSRIVWFGDESERRMCKFCKTTKLERSGRYYSCNTCNQRFPVSENPEEVRVDVNVSKLDIHPAMVFKDGTEEDAQHLVRDELKAKYKIKDDFIEFDDKVFRRPGVVIKDEFGI